MMDGWVDEGMELMLIETHTLRDTEGWEGKTDLEIDPSNTSPIYP